MRTLIIIQVLLFSLSLSISSYAADYNKGLIAAQNGDFATALKEWKPLAEQGDASAQGNLGVMYAFGNGVIKDYVYAHMWGNIASMNGNDLGALLRDDFAEKMTSSQIEEAQRLARECVKKNYKGC